MAIQVDVDKLGLHLVQRRQRALEQVRQGQRSTLARPTTGTFQRFLSDLPRLMANDGKPGRGAFGTPFWESLSREVANIQIATVYTRLRATFPVKTTDSLGRDRSFLYPRDRAFGRIKRSWQDSIHIKPAERSTIALSGLDEGSRGASMRATVTVDTTNNPHIAALVAGRKGFVAPGPRIIPADARRKAWMVFEGKDGRTVYIPVPAAVRKRIGQGMPKRGFARNTRVRGVGSGYGYIRRFPAFPNAKLDQTYTQIDNEQTQRHQQAVDLIQRRAEVVFRSLWRERV